MVQDKARTPWPDEKEDEKHASNSTCITLIKHSWLRSHNITHFTLQEHVDCSDPHAHGGPEAGVQEDERWLQLVREECGLGLWEEEEREVSRCPVAVDVEWL